MKTFATLALCTAFLFSIQLSAQEKVNSSVEMDKTVHNFGDVMLSDGPQKCEFKLKNTGSKPLAIYNVISSCGCTGVEWTKEPIKPGDTGKVSATYSNDEGPYPFDKTLTMYVSADPKPIILRLRGVAHEKQLSLEELYTIKMGPLGLRNLDVKAGNMEQGMQKSDEFFVANLSSKTVKLSFSNVSDGLSIRVEPEKIPAHKTATVKFTVKSDRSRWGKNYYFATPVVDGKSYSATGAPADKLSPGGKNVIGFWAITKENFSNLSKEQKANGSRPMFDNSTFTFGKVSAGKQIDAEFVVKNEGKSELVFYKADFDFDGASLKSPLPNLAPGQKATLKIHLDTTKMPEGEALVILQLITNSPSRPLADLFLTGWITE